MIFRHRVSRMARAQRQRQLEARRPGDEIGPNAQSPALNAFSGAVFAVIGVGVLIARPRGWTPSG